MPENAKPAWVEAVEEAKKRLRDAESSQLTPQEKDIQARLAYAWMDVAKMLKGD